jgi:glycosyltransferase involved in cell wall biosynthesis
VVTGTVADVAAFYRDADLAVIPIRAGGGTRIKLLEAAVHGVPIVSTTFGAQGTTFRRGRDLLLADSEEAFVRACGVLLRNSRELRSLAARARLTVMRDYDSERWALRVGACIADLTGCGVTTAMKANK